MENNLILLVMAVSLVIVFLMRKILGTGFLRFVKGIIIWFLLSALGTSIVTSSKEKLDTNVQNDNKITGKIFLKNITTGLKSSEISGLKYVLKQKEMDTVTTDLLGKNRVITLHKGNDNSIYKIETVGQDFLSEVMDLKNAIEGRLAKDNGFAVQLKCVGKNEGVFEEKTQICSISNDTQKLELKYVKFKPDSFVNNYMWSITLEDLTLSKIKSEADSKYWQKKREEDLAKMKSQI